MLDDTNDSLEGMMKNNKKVILVGDFNCGNIDWENLEAPGNENSWGNRLLQLAMNNLLKQWVSENTRYRGDDEPTRLDLVFSKKPQEMKVDYQSPVGKSDHVLLELETVNNMVEERGEPHKANRLNDTKTWSWSWSWL